jgi:hypothetical protein
MFMLPFVGCDAMATTWLFISIGILAGASWSSTEPSAIEMSPNFAGRSQCMLHRPEQKKEK